MLSRRLLFLVSAGSLCVPHQALCTRADAEEHTKKGGIDCSIPACHSKAEMFKAAMQKAKIANTSANKGGDSSGGGSSSGSSSSSSSSSSSGRVLPTQSYSQGCPVDKDELGNSTWNLLHTIAATYKEDPTEEEQQMMMQFFKTLSLIYPCPHCAEVKLFFIYY